MSVGKFFAVAATAFAVVFGLAMLGAANRSGDPIERINQECQKEFGSQGSDAVARCAMAVAAKRALDNHRDKLESAYERSR